jgi:hypothetical protein
MASAPKRTSPLASPTMIADAAYLEFLGDRQSLALGVFDLRDDATDREYWRHIQEGAGGSEDFHRVAGTFK